MTAMNSPAWMFQRHASSAGPVGPGAMQRDVLERDAGEVHRARVSHRLWRGGEVVRDRVDSAGDLSPCQSRMEGAAERAQGTVELRAPAAAP